MSYTNEKIKEKTFFDFSFLELGKHWANIMYRPHSLTMGLRVPVCGSLAVGGKLDELLISAHLLHVGRQQKSRRQKRFLFIHHFGLTWSVVEGALKTDKQQSGLSCDWNKLALWAWIGLGKEYSINSSCKEKIIIIIHAVVFVPLPCIDVQDLDSKDTNIASQAWQPVACVWNVFPLTCRDEVHVLTHSVEQQPLKTDWQTQTTGMTHCHRVRKRLHLNTPLSLR